MKILVPVKRVLDPDSVIRIAPDGLSVDRSMAREVMNPYDEVALESAVRLREEGVASEVVAVNIGNQDGPETLRVAMALGADRAIHVALDEHHPAPPGVLNTAKIVEAISLEEGFELVICGSRSSDIGSHAMGAMLSSRLGWPLLFDVSKFRLEENVVFASRETEQYPSNYTADLPCVVTTELSLCIPRLTTLPNIMRARRKPLTSRPIYEFDIDSNPRHVCQGLQEPPVSRLGYRVKNVHELVEKLNDAEHN